jgi:hypothetical protein
MVLDCLDFWHEGRKILEDEEVGKPWKCLLFYSQDVSRRSLFRDPAKDNELARLLSTKCVSAREESEVGTC